MTSPVFHSFDVWHLRCTSSNFQGSASKPQGWVSAGGNLFLTRRCHKLSETSIGLSQSPNSCHKPNSIISEVCQKPSLGCHGFQTSVCHKPYSSVSEAVFDKSGGPVARSLQLLGIVSNFLIRTFKI